MSRRTMDEDSLVYRVKLTETVRNETNVAYMGPYATEGAARGQATAVVKEGRRWRDSECAATVEVAIPGWRPVDG